MKNRFEKMGKSVLLMATLLVAGGLSYSCTDDYDLDETMPGFLGQSIYDELKAKGNFTTVVRLIDELGYADVLSKTGSKTLFVADDAAYAEFFKNNKWKDASGNPIDSYDKLSVSQKKYLLYNSMLNNAYVMEMMSNVESSSSTEGKNLCLRQGTAATVTDTIPFFKWMDLPENLNQGDATSFPETKYWDRYRNQLRGPGIYLVCDNTTPMLTHFLESNLKNKNITNDDVAFILGIPSYGTENRAYLYGCQVKQRDVTCMNGYYNVLDKVLEAPSNMAEVIRTNGSTNLFSRILDRFSAPFYDAEVTANAKALYHEIQDSVFVKRYFATRTQSGKLSTDPDKKTLSSDFPYLSFDPGWNSYKASTTLTAEQDMGAMFVPSDAALTDYFIHGGGRVLMERYHIDDITPENLPTNIDQIPLNIISALVNNLMKSSFNETVPSKYLTIMNDARDQMFNAGDYPSVEAYKKVIDKCLLANNGVVYVMNTVISPADYAAVIAPALYSQNTQVVSTVVRADENFIQGSDYNQAPLQQYFSTYLKAMQSSFSFFVPTDEGLLNYGYVDPAALAASNKNNYRYWTWQKESGKSSTSGHRIAITANAYNYNPATGQSGNPEADGWKGSTYRSLYSDDISSSEKYGRTKKELLIEMINQHIVVHDNNDNNGVLNTSRKYFLSRSGAPVVIVSGNTGAGRNMVVNGGWQVQLKNDDQPGNEHDCNVLDAHDQSKATNGYGNGHTFLLDRPMQPSMQTVYGVMNANKSEFGDFLDLCEGYSADILSDAGFKEDLRKQMAAMVPSKTMTDDDWAGTAALYRIFASGTVAKANYYGADQLVRFFNNYRYTVYVPTNAAVQDAIAHGLPTWESIRTWIDDHMEDITEEVDGELTTTKKLSEENKLKAEAQVTLLVNFLKYHFQDQSLFVDNVNNSGSYQTASIDEQNDVYQVLKIKQSPNAMSVTDQAGTTHNVVTADGKFNLLVRDAKFNNNPIKNPASCKFVESSSYAVVHQVSGALNFIKNFSGNYSDYWEHPAKAKAFLKKYQIRK